MGFINSPITNLDVSAALGVRSNSVFMRAEPKSSPERVDAPASSRRWWGWGSPLTVGSELLPN